MWLRYCHAIGTLPSVNSGKLLSLTFSVDVATLVAVMVIRNNGQPLQQQDKIVCFNLACSEMLTHKEFVQEIANCMNLPEYQEKDTNIESLTSPSLSYYPSTSRGPINVNKIIQENSEWWKPTPINEAIQCSVVFLENSMKQGWNRSDCLDVIRSLASDLGLERSKHRRQLVNSLFSEYGESIIDHYPWKGKKSRKKRKTEGDGKKASGGNNVNNNQ